MDWLRKVARKLTGKPSGGSASGDSPEVLEEFTPDRDWKYFRKADFKQRARHGLKAQNYPRKWLEERLDVLVTEVLDPVREAWGSPILIVSGYRSPQYNAAVGGEKKSQHLEGRAADIRPVQGTAEDLHKLILKMYLEGKLPQLGGLGKYKTFVHVDIRPGGKRLARWNG